MNKDQGVPIIGVDAKVDKEVCSPEQSSMQELEACLVLGTLSFPSILAINGLGHLVSGATPLPKPKI